MGVYIKGMEMPKSCPCELLGIGYDLSCSFAGGIPARVKEYYECCQNDTRPSWCPIAPVPAHGRLIDADKMRESVKRQIWIFKLMVGERSDFAETLENGFLQEIANAPTVISAEPSEAQHEYEAAVEQVQYCERHEPTYDPDTGAL